MNRVTFDKLISSPQNISPQEAGELDELLSSFPYCQIGYILMAKESHDKKSMLYPQKLRRAATYSLNRRVLHQLIHTRTNLEVQERQINSTILSPKEHTEITLAESKLPLSVVPINELALPAKVNNDTLLKELEENIRILRSHKHLYRELHQEEDKSRTAIPVTNQQDNVPDKLPTTEILPFPIYPRRPLFIEETKLGDELSSDLAFEGSELHILLSYLYPSVPENKQQLEIINRFIETEPRLSKSTERREDLENTDLSQHSTKLKIELITENYAQILVKQNKLEKAKQVYHKLIAKYPDKSAYFAAKIHELEIK